MPPEKGMATHSSTLAWRIPGMADPGGLPSLGSQRVVHDWSDLAAAAMPHGMWDLSSLTRDRTCTPCIGSAKSQPLDPQGSPLI